jgi:hypothetical protein
MPNLTGAGALAAINANAEATAAVDRPAGREDEKAPEITPERRRLPDWGDPGFAERQDKIVKRLGLLGAILWLAIGFLLIAAPAYGVYLIWRGSGHSQEQIELACKLAGYTYEQCQKRSTMPPQDRAMIACLLDGHSFSNCKRWRKE